MVCPFYLRRNLNSIDTKREVNIISYNLLNVMNHWWTELKSEDGTQRSGSKRIAEKFGEKLLHVIFLAKSKKFGLIEIYRSFKEN